MKIDRYAQFSERIHAALRSGRVPLEATLELSHRCPLACVHCYNNLPVGDREALAAELGLDEYRRLLDEMKEAGTLWLLLTGGEVFARRDALDVYDLAHERGFLITLFSNATMVTAGVAGHLAKRRPFAIEVTIYGATAAVYERLTGVPGSYERCLHGIQLLKSVGLPLKLKTVATRVNVHELRAMQRLAEDELGLPFKFDAALNPRIDCSHAPLDVRLSPEEVVKLDVEDLARMNEWRRFASEFVRPPANTNNVYQCGGGASAFAVDPYGKMTICVLSKRHAWDLRRGSFREGWERHLKEAVRDRQVSRVTKCTACHLKSLCGMCPANGELTHGDAERPVDFLCEVAHLRAHAIGCDIPAHGDCEYCRDGSRHAGWLAAAARIDAHRLGGAPRQVRRSLAVVGQSSSGAGGCGSCH